MNKEHHRERFDSATTTVVIVSIVMFVLLNWPYEYVATAHQFDQLQLKYENSFRTFLFSQYEVKQGGFPFAYLVSYEDDLPSAPQLWSPVRLGFNVVIALFLTILFGITCAVTKRRYLNHNMVPADQLKRTKFTVVTVFFGMVTAVFALLVAFNGDPDRRLAQQIAQSGVVHRYTLVPRSVASIFPQQLLGRFARIRGVVIWNNHNELIAQAAKVPTLSSLGLIGDAPTQSLIPLLQDHRLNSLYIRRATIDPTLKHPVSIATSLRKLELLDCTGLDTGFAGIEHLNRLRYLSLTNSDLRLSSLSTTGWPNSLTELYLTRPVAGADSLRLEDLSSLKVLAIARTDLLYNTAIVDIQLKGLPALESMWLETMQKYALKIESAPRLKQINVPDPELFQKIPVKGLAPVHLWLQSLELDDCSSLSELKLDGVELEKLSMQGTPNLTRISIGRLGYNLGLGYRPIDASGLPRIQSLIDSIGACDGPAELDLSMMPLGDIDFGSLGNNRRLRSLLLMRCGIKGPQLQMFESFSQLKMLDLRGCPISDSEANDLLCQGLPLDKLLVSSNHFERIEVVNQAKLSGFIATDSLLAKSVFISNSPQLQSELILGDRVEHLCIRDGHSLRGLSVDGPLPVHTELRGLRSLKFFAIGGPRANDELCRNLWQCADLDHLTIAYGNLTRKSLENVGKFTKLTVLSLPGSVADDEIVANHWRDLHQLSDVNLSDTEVSAKTVKLLLECHNLQKLSLNHCSITQADLVALPMVNQLIELEVSGTGLDSNTLLGCLQKGMLDRLDLSHAVLSDASIEVLVSAAANSLLFLGLQGCDIKESQLKRIADAHPKLAFDVADNELSDSLVNDLRGQQRLLDRNDRNGFLRLLSDGETIQMSDIKAEHDPVRGRINHYQFASRGDVDSGS